MAWDVEYTDAFEAWWNELAEGEQVDVAACVGMLGERGPQLPYPYSSDIRGSRHGHIRELRVQTHGNPFRIFYAFDPRRTAILLIGGDKTGDRRFYERMIPIADDLYDEHLRELEEE
jgi:hypothetical protein